MTAGEENSVPPTDREYLKVLGWYCITGLIAMLIGRLLG